MISISDALKKSCRMLRLAYSRLIAEKGDGLFYINGPETLPPPLPRELEAEYIERMEIDEDARIVLVEHNLRLVVYIAKKFESTGIGIEDLISIGPIGLIKAINTFKSDRNIKLATYASRCIETKFLCIYASGARHGARCPSTSR